jgi:membrane protease YdiL (CAAX protease family)
VAELVVFLLLLLPGIVLAQVSSASGDTFVLASIGTILHDIALGALVLFFVWSSGRPISAVGWTTRHLGREIGLGVILYPAMLVALALVSLAVRAIGIDTSPSHPGFLDPGTPAQVSLACVLVAVVAIAEETIFRGYLLLRLRELMGIAPAIAIASAVFAFGHTYEGLAGVLIVGVMGVVFALVYVWRKSLVAPIVMHALQDLLGIVIAPWLLAHH